jgi:hypothetical protein
MTYHARALFLTLVVGMAGWNVAAQGATPMSDVRTPQPLCVGRFAVDLPADAKPTLAATYHYIDTQSPKPAASFDAVSKEIETRAHKLKSIDMARSHDRDEWERRAGYDPNKEFGKTQLVGSETNESLGQILLAYHPDIKSPRTITEVHRVFNGWQYVFQSEDAGANAYPATRDAMWTAVAQFQPLSDRTQPNGSGFCVPGGMFADDGRAPVHESFTLVVHFKSHPGVQFTIDAHAIDRVNTDEPSLKHRVDSELGILRANVGGHVGVLVRGEREAAGQQGYQIGLSVPNDTVPNTTAYKFFWSADGVPNDVTRPFMEVDLTIQPDEHKPATIKTADEAKVLWENLLQGLRIRPGAARR